MSPSKSASSIMIIGLPAGIRQLIEADCGHEIMLRSILMKRDGGYLLDPPPSVAVQMIEQFAATVTSYDGFIIILLPYARVPQSVIDTVAILEEFGARVIRPTLGSGIWPTRPKRFDNDFLQALQAALSSTINGFKAKVDEQDDQDRAVIVDILRGLVTHSKMGPNNHSHEDDLWKSRGQNLGPGGRNRIEAFMLRERLIARKKNMSKGGTGWVYWIDDVAKVRSNYPEFEPYFNKQG